MTLSLAKAIAQCPKSMFGKKPSKPGAGDGRPPNFRGIFATVAKAMLTDAGVKYSEATVDALAELINPSTLQRQVAQHRETITGKIDGGVYLPIPEKKPKVKVAPRGVDPISGEKVKGKGKKTTKPAKAVTKAPAKAPAKPAKAPAKPAKAAPTTPKPAKPSKAPAKPAAPAKGGDALAKARAALAAKKAAAKPAPAEVDDDNVI